MKILAFVLFSLCFSVGLAAQDKNNIAAKDCVTHKTINQTSYVSHAIVSCAEAGENAQVSIAHSTHWNKWLTLAATLIGALGFFALYLALRQTQKSTAYATDILNTSRDDQRCDFGINVALGQTNDWHWPANFDCQINIKNIGNTPSNSTRFSWGLTDYDGAVTGLIEGGVIGSDVAGMIESDVFVLAPGVNLDVDTIEDTRQIVFRLECFDKYAEPICIDWIIDYYVVNHNVGNQILPHNCELHFNNITQAQFATYRGVDNPEAVMANARKKTQRSKA